MALPVRRATPQVEFYFSDSNLPRDKFLLEKVAETEEGWVDIALISIFSRTAQLLKIVNKDPSKVRRRAARLVLLGRWAACRKEGLGAFLAPSHWLRPALRPAWCQLCVRAAQSTSDPWGKSWGHRRSLPSAWPTWRRRWRAPRCSR